MTLLAEARAAGVRVGARGDQLVVRGPKTAEPLALRLLDHKPEVMAALSGGHPEIRWRVEAMRPRVPLTGPIPPMYARRLPSVPEGSCLSCGDRLTPGTRYCCEPCVLAAWAVLSERRADAPRGPFVIDSAPLKDVR